MKKKHLITAGILALVLILATLIGPQLILNAVRQPQPAEHYAYADSFRTDYESTRTRLRELTADLGTQLHSHPIDESDDLYIDTFYLPAKEHQTNLIILTISRTVSPSRIWIAIQSQAG